MQKRLMVKKFYLVFILSSLAVILQAQTYSLKDLEAQFLKNNLQLIAYKFHIDKAEALIVQEKLWANPNLTVDNLNLWANSSFETMPNMIGNFGSKQQINMGLEQLIETAGKRKKRVAIKTLEKTSAQLEFEEILRQLKLDLRTNFYSLQRIQLEEQQLHSILELFSKLNEQYKVQAEKQHVSQVSYLRVHTELVGIQKELLDLKSQKNEILQQLKTLTHLPDLNAGQLSFDQFQVEEKTLLPNDLKDQAKSQNIYLRSMANEIQLSEGQLSLEKAQRTPNLNLLMNYERGGNVMSNFIGIGVNIDLPIFNRNKGNIQAAKIQVEQGQAQLNAGQLEIGNEIDKLLNKLALYRENLTNWKDNNTEAQQQVLENYIKYLKDQQVTLIEFIDFSQAFREAQQAYLELQESYLITFEQLQYVVGQEL
ncbi:TolC family protein [Sphingobacterium mizutaii]|uniref:TolC family protein n=1 Tax=Sphingobacterium mizutaii TaxID=1010 RepID=UPI00289FF56B|nr:TolC family protein [Sphingobacterium mizutaii]